MPLRDHYNAPIIKRHSWEGFHAAWPAMLVVRLVERLPSHYIAEPRVKLGSSYYAAERERENSLHKSPPPLDPDIGEHHEYEVLIFDKSHGRNLIAAVEFVCPANKERPESRRAFVAKCAALLRNKVCVAIVDVVTTRNDNLYAEMLALIELSDPNFGPQSASIYAATCRTRLESFKPKLDCWAYPMKLGQPLPEIPLCLSEDVVVPLELEASYEDTCRLLHIP